MNLKRNRLRAIPMLLRKVVNLRENVFDVIFNKSLLISNISELNRILHKTSENKKAPDRRIQKAIDRALWMSPAGANPNNNIANSDASTHYRITITYDLFQMSDIFYYREIYWDKITLPEHFASGG